MTRIATLGLGLRANVLHSLEDLGLGDVLDAGNTAAAVEPAAEGAATAEAKKREAINVGVGEDGFEDFLPEVKRGGGFGERESKFGFDTLAAPVAKEDGSGYRYATKTFTVQEGTDPEKHKQSINSAVSAYNKAQKDEHGEKGGARLAGRSVIQDGALVAVKVFRIDFTV